MFAGAAREMDSRAAASQLAAALAYTVVGRVVALVILEVRAWNPGLENLWVHCDSEGAIDRAGVVDATLRVLPLAAGSAMWAMVGSAVVATATQVPLRAGACEATGMRRAQAVLDSFVSFGLPVRGAHRKGLL
jgi:hypothetical protein